MNKQMKLYGIGHAMVDYYCVLPANIAVPSPLFLGAANHVDAPDMDVLLEKMHSLCSDDGSFVRVAGGTCANILKLCAQAGADTLFSATTGAYDGRRDTDSYFFQEQCVCSGLNAFLRTENGATGRCLISYEKDNTQKAIVASPSIARSIQKSQVLADEFTKADCIILEGMIFMNTEVAVHILELCGKYNTFLALDVASSFCAPKAITKLAKFVEKHESLAQKLIIFANELEYSCIEKDAKIPLEALLTYDAIIVEKRGEKGSRAYYKSAIVESCAEKFCVVDDTGAGDAFAAGFLLHFLDANKNKRCDVLGLLQDSLNAGNAKARTVLSNFGCK